MRAERLDAALGYAGRGRSVIPVTAGGKLPAISWARYQTERADTQRICHWWAREDFNIGVVCGRISDLVVLDIDPRHGGYDSLAALTVRRGLPSTPEVATPAGGSHLWFRHPGVEVRNSAGLLGPGLDVRADGGFVVAPPSERPDGRYEWCNWLTEPAPLPEWLTQQLSNPSTPREQSQEPRAYAPLISGDGRRERYLNAATSNLLNELGNAPQGARNHALYRVAVRAAELVTQGIPEGFFEEIARTAKDNGLDDTEIAATIKSARKRHAR